MKTWHEIRRFPLAVRLLLVNQLGVNTGFYLLIPYLATHLTENLGLSAAVVGVVLGVRNLSQQGLFIIGGSASDRLGARGVIIAGCALRTLGFALFALGDGLAVLLAASVLSGVAGALFNPAVRAYLAQEAGENRAEAFALFNARIALAREDDTVSIELWSQNLLDEDYIQVGFNGPYQAGDAGTSSNAQNDAVSVYDAFLGAPRTVGVTLRSRF